MINLDKMKLRNIEMIVKVTESSQLNDCQRALDSLPITFEAVCSRGIVEVNYFKEREIYRDVKQKPVNGELLEIRLSVWTPATQTALPIQEVTLQANEGLLAEYTLSYEPDNGQIDLIDTKRSIRYCIKPKKQEEKTER